MTKRQIRLMIGSLLHDLGKVVYQSGDGRNHSRCGYDFLKTEAGIRDEEILNCVLYHHGAQLKQAPVEKDSLAYITYIADHIAAAADRRESTEDSRGFDREMPLSSVFNILNGRHGDFHYEKKLLDVTEGINHPTEQPVKMDESFYQKIRTHLRENLHGFEYSEEYFSSLLQVVEATLSYVPSSTSRREQADISLYDHLKVTAAVAGCIEQYLRAEGIDDYRDALFIRAEEFYEKKVFLLYSLDISGIQSFIYTISSEGALRGLRARSFYLDILMEHVIDELLQQAALSRANLIYSGGGHCYLLLPNTEQMRAVTEKFEQTINEWLIRTFGTALYIGGGYAQCSAQNLKNVPEGSYAQIYRTASAKISEKKMHRYSADQIRTLNHAGAVDGERECCVCRRVDRLDGENRCPVCAALQRMSSDILYKDFFLVTSKETKDALPLPMGRYLTAGGKELALRVMETSDYVRCYTKNRSFIGKHVATRLWCGNYTTGDTFDEFAAREKGIGRIAILRADVDNLGTAFVSGFKNTDERYATLSRSATLSRQLSLFFKCYINRILEEADDHTLTEERRRSVTIVYSGGDDVFLVGSWDSVIGAAIDLHKAFARFTQGALTFSCGIGLYKSGYPINLMAKEAEHLESCSKNMDGKNAITLFHDSLSFGWEEFLNEVLAEKFAAVRTFFDTTDERGMAFLYRLVALIRDSENTISTARYVYLLSRLEPDKKQCPEKWIVYRSFSEKMYRWWGECVKSGQKKKILAALYLYSYMERGKETAEEV